MRINSKTIAELIDDGKFDDAVVSEESVFCFSSQPHFPSRGMGQVHHLRVVKGRRRPTGMDLIEQLMIQREIPPSEREGFEELIGTFAKEAKRREAIKQLPEKPVRDIQPYEGVIAYIKDPEGLGPWLNAGLLTRPKINELSPRAYRALTNWLRNPSHQLEDYGLDIPKKSDLVDMELAEKAGEARHFTRLLNAQNYRAKKASLTGEGR